MSETVRADSGIAKPLTIHDLLELAARCGVDAHTPILVENDIGEPVFAAHAAIRIDVNGYAEITVYPS